LINGSLQLMGRKESKGRYVAQDHFLFSQLYCVSDRLKSYCASDRYMGGNYALTDAIAISGAAISPLHAHNPLLQALLVLGNVRLGQWLDNPAVCEHERSWFGKLGRWLWVSPLRLLVHWFRPAERRPFCFVTDGGHHENLGIEALLKRRCRLIIACDAGQDEQHSFLDFSRVLTRMRLEEGITLRPLEQSEQVMKLDLLMPEAKERYTKDHFFVAEIVYPDVHPERSYLIYIKSSLTGDEPTELLQYHRFNTLFPHDPTADQFYGPERFAPYVQLGSHMADIVCRHLPPRLDELSAQGFIAAISGDADRRRYSRISTAQPKVLMDLDQPVGEPTDVNVGVASYSPADGGISISFVSAGLSSDMTFDAATVGLVDKPAPTSPLATHLKHVAKSMDALTVLAERVATSAEALQRAARESKSPQELVPQTSEREEEELTKLL
jgi:hypothetical protein